jgi:hypothetical protein
MGKQMALVDESFQDSQAGGLLSLLILGMVLMEVTRHGLKLQMLQAIYSLPIFALYLQVLLMAKAAYWIYPCHYNN